MIKMTAIVEPEMVDFFNNERFSGEILGYVAVDTTGTKGVLLYQQNKANTEILAIDTDDVEVAEGLLRTTIYQTLQSGALTFCDKSSIMWGEGFNLEKTKEYKIEEFFLRDCKGGCKGCKQGREKTN